MSIIAWLDRWSGYADFVAHMAERRLRQETRVDLAGVACQWSEGVLTLRGRVHTLSLKRIAEALARRLDEVSCVVNEIVIAAPDAQPSLRNPLTTSEEQEKGKRRRS
jgi:osmotically-inducible protein OsmY